ncbi:Putative triacylglycerol synthase (diacylglycerol acyltransferase) [Mycobacterium tuberculosis]|nr:Putative triacylglycerol synthase (diacylglycerol acyltransferase) [Mycobacterium tuberculosis]
MAAADALFLWAETPTRPLHVGALAVLSQPDNGTGRYLRKVFSAAVARQQVAPWWRRRPHRSLTSLGQWSWRTETEVDLDYHVRLSALPPRAGTAELWALVSELHAGMLDRSRPLWQVDLIEGLPGGRCAVYVKVHHALADGVSVMRGFYNGSSPRTRISVRCPPCGRCQRRRRWPNTRHRAVRRDH